MTTEEEPPIAFPPVQTVDYSVVLEDVFHLHGYADLPAFHAADKDVQHFLYKLAAHRFANAAMDVALQNGYLESCILYDKSGFAHVDRESIVDCQRPVLK